MDTRGIIYDCFLVKTFCWSKYLNKCKSRARLPLGNWAACIAVEVVCRGGGVIMREMGRRSSLLSCWHLIVFLNRLLL